MKKTQEKKRLGEKTEKTDLPKTKKVKTKLKTNLEYLGKKGIIYIDGALF